MRSLAATMVLTAATILAGCGDDEVSLPDLLTLFPANSEVGSWVEDTGLGNAGVETATTDAGVVALIDGGADPFLNRDYNGFGIEYYTDTTYKLELRVWQFKTVAVSEEVYDALLTESSTHKSSTWEGATLGDEARVANTMTAWWFNVRKGPHLIEATIGAVSGGAPDATSKTAGQTFINAVLGKM